MCDIPKADQDYSILETDLSKYSFANLKPLPWVNLTEKSVESKNISMFEKLNELCSSFPKDEMGRVIETYSVGPDILTDPFELLF